jgi:deazaflavin-dependent oxidoreductase (nitroreductase family)
MRVVASAGLLRGYALLETTGHRSGLPRRTPIGGALQGGTFWIVAEHGRHAHWVRNLTANPRVRLKLRGRWRTGIAQVVPDDDTRARQRSLGLGHVVNAAMVRALGTELTTVRIDLDRS